MSRVVITADGYLNSIPLLAPKIGPNAGRTRQGMIKLVFGLADEFGYRIDVEGQHWPTHPATPEVSRMASNKLSRGMKVK